MFSMKSHLEAKTYSELQNIEELKYWIWIEDSIFQASSTAPTVATSCLYWIFKEDNLKPICVSPGAIKLWPAAISTYSLITYQFYREELSSCDRDHIAHKAKSIYYLALDRKRLLTFMLNELDLYAKWAPSLF